MTSSTFSPLGRYPSPVFRAARLSTPHAELFIKDDGILRDDYGGNKVRKLEGLLPELTRRGTRRVLTLGPAGSHHVLATTLLAGELGIATAAVLCPQHYSRHSEETLTSALALGLEPIAVGSSAAIPFALLRAKRPGDAIIAAGGSSPLGVLGYVRAVLELKEQIEAGLLPEPDLIVVAAGSGGTAAGLLAGLVQHDLRARLVAVDVGAAGPLAGSLVIGLAAEVLRRSGHGRRIRELWGRLRVDRGHRGGGYSQPLPGFPALEQLAGELSLSLDATYTGKTLAAALDLVEHAGEAQLGSPLRVLYWHTLSKGLPAAPRPAALTEELRRLFVKTTRGL